MDVLSTYDRDKSLPMMRSRSGCRSKPLYFYVTGVSQTERFEDRLRANVCT